MKLLSIGDKVQQGTYKVHSRFNRVINFINCDQLISIVEKEIGAGPVNIVFEGVNLDGIHALKIEHQSILLGKIKIDFQNIFYYHSSIDFEHWDIKTFKKNLTFFKTLLIKTSPQKSLAFLLDEGRINDFHSEFEKMFVKQISNGVSEIFNGDMLSGVKKIKGCGFGLTPSGDDFIAGMLIGFNFIQKMLRKNFYNLINSIYEISKGENIFSNTFMNLAKDGMVFEKMKRLLTDISYRGEKEICQSTERLFSVGASSGADMATGFYMTIQSQLNQ